MIFASVIAFGSKIGSVKSIFAMEVFFAIIPLIVALHPLFYSFFSNSLFLTLLIVPDELSLFNYCFKYNSLLHLPTQMRFLIGGERVTCRGLNLSNSLGRIKLTNSLGKQQLELWTHT